MNILYLSHASIPDYQSDMLLHGLKSLFGPAIIDFPKPDYMYNTYKDLSCLYGRGFTLYGGLEDGPVDRTFLVDKIRDHYFDLIIYGSIQRYRKHYDWVLEHYRKHEILLVDGEDQSHVLYDCLGQGIYFKRELAQEHPQLKPIHFAIPSRQIGLYRQLPKTRVRAHMDPRDLSTYIYTDESSYYQDYAQSLFAFTTRKSGWDCLRHYEIIANMCIPLFLDLDKCPTTTCMNLPKPELLEALQLQDLDSTYWDTADGKAIWQSLHRRIHIKFVRYSTTEQLAQYVLETQRIEASLAT
jgi:hypothetical protein